MKHVLFVPHVYFIPKFSIEKLISIAVKMQGIATGNVAISFDDICVSVKPSFQKEKQIIFNVSGWFPGGKLIGILGPSGAGKSTLLNVLSGFDHADFTGGVLIDGEPRKMESFRKISRYITQDNDLQTLLTVQENMKFAADLKLGQVDDYAKHNLVDKILEAFGLTETRDTLTSRISGGEKKRLSIALELISDPAILFLDEPTSGLDVFSSFNCMEYLKNLTLGGKTVVCSIHQPSATIFQMFDVVYILAEGRCLYHGQPDQIIRFFDDIQLPCNISHNPADYAIELASGEYGRNYMDLMNAITQNGTNLEYFQCLQNEQIETVTRRERRSDLKASNNSYLSSELYEFKTLLYREYIKLKRNKSFTHVRLITSVTNSIVLSLLFWRLGNDASLIWYNYNLLLAITALSVFGGAMLTVLIFPTEVKILRKEFFNGYHSLKHFFISITLLELPLSFICNFILISIIYYCTEQPPESERFVMLLTFGYMFGIVAQSMGLLLGAALTLKSALVIGCVIHVSLSPISGIALTFCDVPAYLKFFAYSSYLYYGLDGMAGAVYGYNRTKLPCPEDKFCFYRQGDDFLRDMCLGDGGFWSDFGILCLFYLVLRVAAYVSMWWKISRC